MRFIVFLAGSSYRGDKKASEISLGSLKTLCLFRSFLHMALGSKGSQLHSALGSTGINVQHYLYWKHS